MACNVKCEALRANLAGKAHEYYRKRIQEWWAENPTVVNVMNHMENQFKSSLSKNVSVKLLTSEKDSKRLMGFTSCISVP